MHTYAESKRPRTQNLTDSGLTLFGGNSKRNEQVVRPVKSNPERVCTQCNSTCRLPVSACLLNRSAVADGYVPALYTSEPARASKRARKQERERGRGRGRERERAQWSYCTPVSEPRITATRSGPGQVAEIPTPVART